MRFPEWLDVYGDKSYRGKCYKEITEQINSFAWLRFAHPALADIAIHPKMEGGRAFSQIQMMKIEGSLKPGVSDIIIPGSPSFVCELKRKDHTLSSWSDGQIEYLGNCKAAGCFVSVALGFEGLKLAITDYLEIGAKNG